MYSIKAFVVLHFVYRILGYDIINFFCYETDLIMSVVLERVFGISGGVILIYKDILVSFQKLLVNKR